MEERPSRSIIGGQKPIFARAETSVAAAAKLMKRHRIGALLVMKSGRLAGIFTERDALFRVLAEGRDPAKTHLSQVMTLNPRTISPDRPFGHALHLMYEGEFRHVPVIEEGQPLGLVSIGDLVKISLEETAQEAQALRAYIQS